MTQHVRDIMTSTPVTVEPLTSVTAVARLMRDQDIGDVLVTEEGRLRGIVSDRDLVVRALAEERTLSTRPWPRCAAAMCSASAPTTTSTGWPS